MPNDDIKSFMRKRGIHIYEVAQQLGIGEATIYRWLREPLTGNRRERVVNAIRTIAEQQMQCVIY